jgi:hypothetical protein
MSFPFNVEKWRVWLDRAQRFDTDPAPVDLMLEWMRTESGGNVCNVGRVGKADDLERGFDPPVYVGHVYEAGLAQTYFDSPTTVRFGVTSAQLRAKCSGTTMPTNLTDDDRAMHARVCVETIKAERGKARAALSKAGVSWPEDGRDFWAFVKLRFAIPALAAFVAPAARAGRASSWGDFRGYVLGLTLTERAAISPVVARRYGPAALAHWFDVAEEFAATPFSAPSRWKLYALVGSALALLGLAKRKGGSVASG